MVSTSAFTSFTKTKGILRVSVPAKEKLLALCHCRAGRMLTDQQPVLALDTSSYEVKKFKLCLDLNPHDQFITGLRRRGSVGFCEVTYVYAGSELGKIYSFWLDRRIFD